MKGVKWFYIFPDTMGSDCIVDFHENIMRGCNGKYKPWRRDYLVYR